MKRPIKVFYFDVETTGFDPVKNDITQISGMIEIDGKIVEKFDLRAKPLDWDSVSEDALEVTGIGLEELKKNPPAGVTHRELIEILDKYCNKFDRDDKYYFAGYNVRFDIDFLYQFFQKQGDNYFGSWFNWCALDPLSIIHYLSYKGILKFSSHKLEAICESFDIKIKAHDAMNDIEATRKVFKKLEKILKEGKR